MAKNSRQKAVADRTLRSLTSLQANASTARTLNLIAVWETNGDTEDYRTRPLFKHPILNRSIILKHRLREDERDLFSSGETSATKVLLPLDITNLRVGARSFFIEQRGYADILDEILCLSPEAAEHDRSLLGVIDGLPSLDPFLMREHLSRAGFSPARCYFEITKSDMGRMLQFVQKEVAPLIGMTAAEAEGQLHEMASKLAGKIMTNAGDSELEPLRKGLGMEPAAFAEGMFCWKGFLYYKWLLIDLMPKLQPVSAEIARVTPKGAVSNEDKAHLTAARARLGKAVSSAVADVRKTLGAYEAAYKAIAVDKQPLVFRDFLNTAPSLFYDLGEKLGAVQHIVSFWRFRFPLDARVVVSPDELADIFTDFESSISTAQPGTVTV